MEDCDNSVESLLVLKVDFYYWEKIIGLIYKWNKYKAEFINFKYWNKFLNYFLFRTNYLKDN